MSAKYSRPDAAGVQDMFMCRVAVGEYCKGEKDALTPAARQGSMLYARLYDSTVDWLIAGFYQSL